MQQRPEANVELDLLSLEHVIRFAPIGVRQLDLFKVHMRRPAPVDCELGNLGLMAGHRLSVVFDLSANVVRRGEHIGTYAQQSDEQKQASKGPGQDFSYLPHGLESLWLNNARPRFRVPWQAGEAPLR